MSVLIDNTEDLLTLVKKLDLKVNSVEELEYLLTMINSGYDPETARQKTARLVGVAVPCSMAGAAALTSFFLLMPGQAVNANGVAVLAVAWGACALVSVAAVITSAIMLGRRHEQVQPDQSPQRPKNHREPGATGIVKELEI
jgi:hypothetical protein